MPDRTVRRILTINTGSSSLKLSVVEFGREERQVLFGTVERIGLQGGRLRLADDKGSVLLDQPGGGPDHRAALEVVLAWLREHRPDLGPDAVGHRVVHGGSHYREPRRITPELVAILQGLIPIAPDHLPQAVQAIQTAMSAFPNLVHVACFDTSFHRQMPQIAQRFPIPRSLTEEGVIRYGFHGLSYEYIMREFRVVAPREADGRVIIAHLGNGASMAAVRGGIGVDTTMGFTPCGGLMMGTRTGDLDPGLLLYLLMHQGMTPTALNELVNRQAGLLGVSGTSADMRDLLGKESADGAAAEAVDMFCYQAKKHVGALAAALGGLDTLIFTGGIGEHAAAIRQRIGTGLEFLGIRIDPGRNEAHAPVISRDDSQVSVRVLPTNEDLMIARHTKELTEPIPKSD